MAKIWRRSIYNKEGNKKRGYYSTLMIVWKVWSTEVYLPVPFWSCNLVFTTSRGYITNTSINPALAPAITWFNISCPPLAGAPCFDAAAVSWDDCFVGLILVQRRKRSDRERGRSVSTISIRTAEEKQRRLSRSQLINWLLNQAKSWSPNFGGLFFGVDRFISNNLQIRMDTPFLLLLLLGIVSVYSSTLSFTHANDLRLIGKNRRLIS